MAPLYHQKTKTLARHPNRLYGESSAALQPKHAVVPLVLPRPSGGYPEMMPAAQGVMLHGPHNARGLAKTEEVRKRKQAYDRERQRQKRAKEKALTHSTVNTAQATVEARKVNKPDAANAHSNHSSSNVNHAVSGMQPLQRIAARPEDNEAVAATRPYANNFNDLPNIGQFGYAAAGPTHPAHPWIVSDRSIWPYSNPAIPYGIPGQACNMVPYQPYVCPGTLVDDGRSLVAVGMSQQCVESGPSVSDLLAGMSDQHRLFLLTGIELPPEPENPSTVGPMSNDLPGTTSMSRPARRSRPTNHRFAPYQHPVASSSSAQVHQALPLWEQSLALRLNELSGAGADTVLNEHAEAEEGIVGMIITEPEVAHPTFDPPYKVYSGVESRAEEAKQDAGDEAENWDWS